MTKRQIIKRELEKILKDDKKATEFEKKLFDTFNEEDYVLESYEKIGQLTKENYPLLIKEIGIKKDFDCHVFSRIKKKVDEQTEKSLLKPKPVEGVYKCKNCKSTKFYTWSAQTRSADEGMTNFGECFDCGKRIKV